MDRRRLVVTTGSVALFLLAADVAWAGPPPPPPSGDGEPVGGAPPMVTHSAPIMPGTGAPRAPQDPLSIDQRTPTTDLGGDWTYSRGGAAGPNYVRRADDDPFFTVNRVGYYQGVSISGVNQPPFAPKEIGGDSAVLTWTGFERGEASSRVFFQLSASVVPEIEVQGTRVFVKLPRTSVQIRNNRRKLITKFFKTPVSAVKINRSGKDVVAVLELRWDAEPSWHFEPGTNGYQVLVLEFSDVQTTDASEGQTPPATEGSSSDTTDSEAFLPD